MNSNPAPVFQRSSLTTQNMPEIVLPTLCRRTLCLRESPSAQSHTARKQSELSSFPSQSPLVATAVYMEHDKGSPPERERPHLALRNVICWWNSSINIQYSLMEGSGIICTQFCLSLTRGSWSWHHSFHFISREVKSHSYLNRISKRVNHELGTWPSPPACSPGPCLWTQLVSLGALALYSLQGQVRGRWALPTGTTILVP